MMVKTTGHRLSPRARRIVAGGALAAALIVAAWAVAATRSRAKAAAKAGEMAGMPDMGGMNMSAGSSARLTAEQVRGFGVTFATVEQRTLHEQVRTVGIVNFDETRIAHVVPKIGGFIERLYVDFTGKPVRRGQPLVEIYSPELLAAQEELLLAARLEKELGESAVPGAAGRPSDLVEAARRRLRLWDISEGQVADVLRSGRARRTLTLYAPVSGIVVEKQAILGHAVQPGENLYTIADLTEVWIEAEIRETDAGLVREGSPAAVELAAYAGRPLAGRVEYVYPTLQPEARTLRARIAVRNLDGRIKPGMYATVRVAALLRQALTIPTSALVRTGERQIAFVDMGGGELMPHEIETGRVTGELTEVLSGVEPGQRVVTSAQFLLDSESNLAEVMKAMMAQMSTADMGQMESTEMGGAMDMKGADMKRMPTPPKQR